MASRQSGRVGRIALSLAGAAFALQACTTAEPPAPERPPPATAPAPAPQATPRKPAPVLGPDGELVVNAMEYPWSAIGRLNAGGRGWCTGVLIGAREVLAPADCLYNAAEGRPWAALELHFVAGYQRDAYLIHAPVADYRTAAGFDPAERATLANAAHAWAVATLREPIGEQAGWLGLAPLDEAARADVAGGAAVLLQAGYRRPTPHVVTAFIGCENEAACHGAMADPDLPVLLVRDGGFQAVDGGALAAGFGGSRGQAPRQPGPAASTPLDTIDALLRHLGYLDGAVAAPTEAQRRLAIEDFQRAAGLPVAGEPSTALLGDLIKAIRAPAPRLF